MLTDLILHTTDPDATAAFYAAFGANLTREPVPEQAQGQEPELVTAWMGDTALMFWSGEPTSRVCLGVTVPDLSAVQAALTDLGVSVEENYGVLTVHDPDGNRVTVRQQRGT